MKYVVVETSGCDWVDAAFSLVRAFDSKESAEQWLEAHGGPLDRFSESRYIQAVITDEDDTPVG